MPTMTQLAHTTRTSRPACPQRAELEADRIWRQHRPALVRYVTRLTGDVQVAEDVAQEVAFRLCQHTEVLDRPGSLSGWMHTVARNVVIDLHRRQQARPADPVGDPELLEPRVQAPDHADRVTADVDVDRLLETLDAPLRDVIESVYVDGRTMQDAARHLDVPLGTVKSRTHRALKELHGQLVR